MDKYYTPEIEDLCVGFEYEMRQYLEDPTFHPVTAEVTNNPKEKWHQFKISSDTIGIISGIINIEYQDGEKCKEWIGDSIRVKYLDKEDIESLGFIQVDYDTYRLGIQEIYLEFNPEYKTFIYSKRYSPIKNDNLFVGNIKNKSELKKLLKQLGIG